MFNVTGVFGLEGRSALTRTAELYSTMAGGSNGAVRVYSNVNELIADRSVDVVYVCTHLDTHAEFAVRAMKEGHKHVFVEKPVAENVSQIEEMIRVATETKRTCFPV